MKKLPKMKDPGLDKVLGGNRKINVRHESEASYQKALKEQTAPKYKIVRYRQNGKKRVIKQNLTLKEAKAHTKNPKTQGDGWFDGFVKMEKKDQHPY